MLELLTQINSVLFLVGILLVVASVFPIFKEHSNKILGFGFLLSALAVFAMAAAAIFLAPK